MVQKTVNKFYEVAEKVSPNVSDGEKILVSWKNRQKNR